MDLIVDLPSERPARYAVEFPPEAIDALFEGKPVTIRRAEVSSQVEIILRPSGEACRECGNFNLVRSGTCMTCQDCGTTTGCS